MRFCFGDADCAALGVNSQCVIGVNDGSGTPIPGFTVCTDQCDVFADTVCAARGQSCRLGTFTGHTGVASYCEAVGAGGQGAACAAGSSACQAGFDCYNVTGFGNICLRYCRLGGGSPSCSGGTTCQSAGTGFPAGVGVCVP